MLFDIMIILAITSLVATCVLHSWGGEAYLLRPLFKYRGNRVLENPLARLVLRFAWHITSLFWLVLAVILYASAYRPESTASIALAVIGASFLFVGIFDLIVSQGRHIGWPFLVLTGAFTLLGWHLM